MPLIKLGEDLGDYRFEIQHNGSDVEILTINVFALSRELNGESNPEPDKIIEAAKKIATPAELVGKMDDSHLFAKASTALLMFDESGNVPEPSQT